MTLDRTSLLAACRPRNLIEVSIELSWISALYMPLLASIVARSYEAGPFSSRALTKIDQIDAALLRVRNYCTLRFKAWYLL